MARLVYMARYVQGQLEIGVLVYTGHAVPGGVHCCTALLVMRYCTVLAVRPVLIVTRTVKHH